MARLIRLWAARSSRIAGPSAAQWDQTFAVSTRAHFLVAAAEALEPGSTIVFISWAASLRAATGIPAYDASNAALPGICRQVAGEGMARGIRANLVVPSLAGTPLGRFVSGLYHSTGSLVRPPVTEPERIRSCSSGTASRIAGKRASSWEKTAFSSIRASGAPRQ